MMNRITFRFSRLVTASLLLCSFFAMWAAAQTVTPKPVPTLPPGMKGADASDPRAKLKPGLFDAGEAASGIKHVSLLRKPDAFQLGVDPNAPKVGTALKALGVPDPAMVPVDQRMAFAGLAFANSDLAFQGNHLFMGNFYGMTIYDITNPANAKLLTSMICPGGQGDVSVYKNLMFMSVEMPNGRLDCGEQGFPPVAPQPGQPGGPAANKERFRGVRIFDISDITKPKQVGAVQTCRGSHTHTLVTDPKDSENVYIYVSGTSFVRPTTELEGCSGAPPDKDPNTSLFRIEVIKVPVARPQAAAVVSTPRVFGDPASGKINALDNGGSHDGGGRPQETNQCHDITAFPEIGLAAGACSGNGILLDIKDPVNPKRVEAVNDPNYAYWHSASFSNDGTKVVYTDEWGGGMGPRCRETDPNKWGANALFTLSGNELTFKNYYKLPAAQTEQENCVAHNGSLVPVPGRDIKVQAWYQGGISLMDFTDPSNPVEIGYFDRGPIDPNRLVMGGSWSAYWYNGNIYSSEIARGLDIFELAPTKFMTQNEIDAAKLVRMAALNVQTQERFSWPRKLVVAKAYVDQLERSGALPADRISALRQGILNAEKSKLGSKDVANLKTLAASVESGAGTAKNAVDAARMQALADVLEQPERS
jgi:hypothetical protein